MSIIFTEGWDHYGATPTQAQLQKAWDTVPATVTLAAGRTGYGACPSTAMTKLLGGSRTRIIIGFAVKIYAGTSDPVFYLFETGQLHVSLSLINTADNSPAKRRLGLYSAGQLRGYTPDLPIGVHSYVEIDVTVHDTLGVLKVWVDGVQCLDYSGDTKLGGTGIIDRFTLQNSSFTWDDIVVIDPSDGVAPTDRIGAVKLCRLYPTGPGSEDDFTPVNAATTWEAVDESPSNEVTDYAYGVDVGDRSLFAMSDLPEGLGGACVGVVGVFDTMTNGSAATCGHSIKVGSTVYDSQQNAVNSGAWVQRQSVLWKPGGGNLSLAQVDAMEAGPLVVA